MREQNNRGGTLKHFPTGVERQMTKEGAPRRVMVSVSDLRIISPPYLHVVLPVPECGKVSALAVVVATKPCRGLDVIQCTSLVALPRLSAWVSCLPSLNPNAFNAATCPGGG
eukprot:2570893-Pyramimonas_sp.AAC.2